MGAKMSDNAGKEPVLSERGRSLMTRALNAGKQAASWSKAQYASFQERRQAEKEAKARHEAHARHRAVLDELEYLQAYLPEEIWAMTAPAMEAVGPNEGYEIAAAIASDPLVLNALDSAREAKRIADLRRDLDETNTFFGNPLNTYRVDLEPFFSKLDSQTIQWAMRRVLTERSRLQTTVSGAIAQAGKSYFEGQVFSIIKYGGHCVVERTLEDMRDDERAILRLTHTLDLFGVRNNWAGLRINMAWGGGAGRLVRKNIREQPSNAQRAAIPACEAILGQTNPREGIDSVRSMLGELLEDPGTDEALRAEIRTALYRGAEWLKREDTPDTIYAGDGADALMLGRMSDGEALTIQGDGSLLTVAPPGSGKTQTQVLPNLLQYRGPAIVLDVKGECYALTADWRREHVGPVYRFAPDDHVNSAGFNPLELIDRAPAKLVRDARTLARLIIPSPPRGKDEFWVESAMNVVAASIAYLVGRSTDDTFPTMGDLVDILSPTADDKAAIEEFCQHHPSRSVNRLWRAIADIPPETRSGIYAQARSNIGAWEGEDIEALTSVTGWDPREFCYPEASPTLYICVSPARLPVLAPMIRILFGMHLNLMIEESERERDDLPVLFMLDELPQLGYMPPVLQGIEVGRSRGVKVWGFCQSLDQIRERYGDPLRFHAIVKAVCYMNPDPETARMLVRDLGWREGLLDGQRKPLAEASELTGPAWRDNVLVTASGMPPARLKKWPLHEPTHPIHDRASWPTT